MAAFPPPQVWGLNPLFFATPHLYIRDVLETVPHPEFSDVHFYLNHPIRNVEIVGIIIESDATTNYISYSIDDGTGIIACIQWVPAAERLIPYRETKELGSLVRVSGKIGEFRERRQLTIRELVIEEDVNFEIQRWVEIVHLKLKIYDIPFVYPTDIVEEFFPAYSIDSNITKEEKKQPNTTTVELSETTFRKSLKEYIERKRFTSFHYGDIRAAEELISIAKQVLLQQYHCTDPAPPRISSLFSRGIKRLVRDGFLYVRDADADVYEVIHHEVNLGKQILQIIRLEMSKHEQDNVNEITIITKIRSIKAFQHVPKEVLLDSLKKLVDSGDLFQPENREYKLI
ncbi:hypothetical protein K7432_011146 [Basidiobolus ranarum]|uniref:CST complex subunit STN1 n=1 Tax=Basidiobolus ranarum TaxID=34480 RepID=A0ABR2VUG7_9FUNG